jgi:hypothetical protein
MPHHAPWHGDRRTWTAPGLLPLEVLMHRSTRRLSITHHHTTTIHHHTHTTIHHHHTLSYTPYIPYSVYRTHHTRLREIPKKWKWGSLIPKRPVSERLCGWNGAFCYGRRSKTARILCVPEQPYRPFGVGVIPPLAERSFVVCLFVLFIILIIIIIINKVKRKDPTHTQTVRDTL